MILLGTSPGRFSCFFPPPNKGKRLRLTLLQRVTFLKDCHLVQRSSFVPLPRKLSIPRILKRSPLKVFWLFTSNQPSSSFLPLFFLPRCCFSFSDFVWFSSPRRDLTLPPSSLFSLVSFLLGLSCCDAVSPLCPPLPNFPLVFLPE